MNVPFQRSDIRARQCHDYSIYYKDPGSDGASFPDPFVVTVYLYRTEEALEALFIPDKQGQTPINDRIALPQTGYYVPAPAGIVFSDPCYRGLSATIANMDAQGTMRTYFRPASPPPYRWSRIELNALALPSALELFCNTLDREYSNGGAICRYCQPVDLDYFMKCQWYQETSFSTIFQTELLRNPFFADLPCFETASYAAIADGPWTLEDPFQIESLFASKVYWGGAYHSPDMSPTDALRMGHQVRTALWGMNYTWHLRAWSCHHRAWSPWFEDQAWDWTFLALDLTNNTIFFLAITDTD